LLKICITPLLVVCSLHLPKIIEFCLRIHILPAKMQVGLTLAGPPCSFFLFFRISCILYCCVVCVSILDE